MGGLDSIAVIFLCIVGGAYSVFLLGDCYYVRWKASRQKSSPRSLRVDWWCQAISAATFLTVAGVLLVMIWPESRPGAGAHDSHEDPVPHTLIPGFVSVPRTHIFRHKDRPGRPICGANLAHDPVTDVDIRALLKEGTEIEFLVLTGTNITDESLAYLRQMPRLKELGLAKTQISDSGCEELAQLASLEFLDLARTGITDDGLEHLSELDDALLKAVAKDAV